MHRYRQIAAGIHRLHLRQYHGGIRLCTRMDFRYDQQTAPDSLVARCYPAHRLWRLLRLATRNGIRPFGFRVKLPAFSIKKPAPFVKIAAHIHNVYP